ncbi:MAG: ankyrin repeat domain-containing protein, partial [Calditrichota bacterium]
MKPILLFIPLFFLACQTTPNSQFLELHQAIQNADSLAFEEALNKNPKSVSLRNSAGKTPLILAAEAGQPGMVARLIENDAAINDTMPNGKNALHRTDNPDIIKLLLQNEADPYQKDQYGNTPLRFNLNYSLRFSTLREQKNAALSAFLASGVQFPFAGEDGRWFMHNAAIVKHGALLRQLLAKGADALTLNDNGGTLLHSAAAGGVLWLADSLLTSGVEVNALNRYGQSALFMSTMEGQRSMTELLISRNAAVGLSDMAGRTPLQYARDFGRDQIIDVLLLHGAAEQPRKVLSQKGAYLGQKAPGREPVLFSQGVVSSIFFDHSAPSFSASGNALYWSPVYTSRGDFIFSMKQSIGGWSVPQIEPFCRIGGTYMYPTLSADGSRLFFASDEALPGQEAGKEMNIWYVEREDSGWSVPHLVG